MGKGITRLTTLQNKRHKHEPKPKADVTPLHSDVRHNMWKTRSVSGSFSWHLSNEAQVAEVSDSDSS